MQEDVDDSFVMEIADRRAGEVGGVTATTKQLDLSRRGNKIIKRNEKDELADLQ
jgi:hypothetical protein